MKLKLLSFIETEKLLKKYKIPFLKQYFSKSLKDAVMYAKEIGYPVVLKIASNTISHKTNIGGVKIDIRDEIELKDAYKEIMKRVENTKLKEKIDGILIQKMVRGENVREVIIGGKHDKQFGPVVMFGLGGIFVEIFKDISFRLVPIKRKDAREMIKEIKGVEVLTTFRGKVSINFNLLEECLLKVSRLMEKEKDIIELDINPLIIDDKKAYAVDVKIFVE